MTRQELIRAIHRNQGDVRRIAVALKTNVTDVISLIQEEKAMPFLTKAQMKVHTGDPRPLGRTMSVAFLQSEEALE